MAYQFQQDEDKQKQQAPSGQAGGNLPTTGGGGAGASPLGANATPTASPFASLTNYLAANQGQGQNVSSTIASNVGNEYNTDKGAIDTAAQKAQQDISGGTVNYNQDLVNRATGNPAQFVTNPTDVSTLTGMRDATYKGPGSFTDSAYYGDAAKALAKANDFSQLQNTGGGYQTLLNQIEKNPTAGKTALDQALIQSDPNAQQTIVSAFQPFQGLTDYLGGKTTDIGNQAQAAKDTTAATGQQTKGALTGAENTFEQGIQARIPQVQQQATQNLTSAQNSLYDQIAQRMGPNFTAEDARNFVHEGGDLSTYAAGLNTAPLNAQINPLDYNKYNVASNDDYARAAALAQLMGTPNTFLPSQYQGQAGQYPLYNNF